jgi:hypothetical protein
MSTVRHLRQETELSPIARKLLCFTDNRQDASLQAGHFNDFIEIGLVRSALFNASNNPDQRVWSTTSCHKKCLMLWGLALTRASSRLIATPWTQAHSTERPQMCAKPSGMS